MGTTWILFTPRSPVERPWSRPRRLASSAAHADLFNARGRAWLARQPLPDDERAAVDRTCVSLTGVRRT